MEGPGPGHKVQTAALEQGPPMLVCYQCGAYAQHRIRNLADPCHPIDRSKNLWLLRKRKHPETLEPILYLAPYYSGRIAQSSGIRSRATRPVPGLAHSGPGLHRSPQASAAPPVAAPVQHPSSQFDAVLSPSQQLAHPADLQPVLQSQLQHHPSCTEFRIHRSRPDPAIVQCQCGACIVCDLFGSKRHKMSRLETSDALSPPDERAIVRHNLDDSQATPVPGSEDEEW